MAANPLDDIITDPHIESSHDKAEISEVDQGEGNVHFIKKSHC